MHTVHVSLDRNHLQLLVALAELGRLSDAAARLHISASAASHRLAEAERRVGVPLTVHRGRTLRLTDAGRHLADVARMTEEELERAELVTRWMGGGETDRVRIAVGFHDTGGWLIDTFAPEPDFPRTELLRFADDRLIDAVRNGEADIAIAPWPQAPTGLHHVALGTDRLVAAVPAASELATAASISPADLAGMTFLTSSYQAMPGFEFQEFFLTAGVIPKTVVQIQSMEMVLRLVGEGQGVTIQPELTVSWNRAHRDVGIVPLRGEQIPLRWTATMRKDADPASGRAAERIAQAFANAAGAAAAPE